MEIYQLRINDRHSCLFLSLLLGKERKAVIQKLDTCPYDSTHDVKLKNTEFKASSSSYQCAWKPHLISAPSLPKPSLHFSAKTSSSGRTKRSSAAAFLCTRRCFKGGVAQVGRGARQRGWGGGQGSASLPWIGPQPRQGARPAPGWGLLSGSGSRPAPHVPTATRELRVYPCGHLEALSVHSRSHLETPRVQAQGHLEAPMCTPKVTRSPARAPTPVTWNSRVCTHRLPDSPACAPR